MASISIALSTYNGAAYIGKQLESLSNQSRLPDELVITDDGSTDDTAVIVEEFSKRAPFPVRIIYNSERLGYRANFMKCVGLCTEELIAFCDQDDVWLPEKLERQHEALQKPNTLLSCHNARLIDAYDSDLGFSLGIFSQSVNGNLLQLGPHRFSPGFTIMIRRELLRFSHLWALSIDLYDRSKPLSHDRWFFFLASVLGNVHYDHISNALYRQHSSNTSGSYSQHNSLSLVRAKLGEDQHHFITLALAWENRQELLNALLKEIELGRVDAGKREAIEDLRSSYCRSADSSRRRAAMYSAPTRLARLAVAATNLLKGDYAIADPWRSSFVGAMRDFTRCLIV